MKFKTTLILILHLWITASTNTIVYGSMMSSGSGSGGNPIMPMTNDTLMPMNSSSGFGSGSGQAPVISNCPMSLSAVTVMPQLGLFSVNISVMLTAMDNENPSSITFSAMNPMQGSSLVPNTTIEGDGSVLTITINGDILNSISMPTTELNITIFASDGFTNSEACILPVTIEYLPISECSAVRTTEQQNTEPVEREINAIYIQVEQSASEITLTVQVLISEALAMFLNSYCAQNCDPCSLSSNCGTLLQFCVEFSSANIFILDIRTVPTVDVSINKKRQIVSFSGNTQIGFAAVVPREIPVTTSTGLPLIPASTLIQVVSNNRNTFETMTGLRVTGDPVAFFNPPSNIPIDFGKIAVIVLPIVVTVLVLALVGGVAIVLLIVFIKKSKKKSKVLPVHTNDSDLRQASQRSNIGKGHMTLETVDH